MSIRAKYRQAEELYEAGDPVSALPIFLNVVDFLDGFTLEQIKQYRIGDLLADCYRIIGECYSYLGNYAKAKSYSEKSLELCNDPDIAAKHGSCALINDCIYAAMMGGE